MLPLRVVNNLEKQAFNSWIFNWYINVLSGITLFYPVCSSVCVGICETEQLRQMWRGFWGVVCCTGSVSSSISLPPEADICPFGQLWCESYKLVSSGLLFFLLFFFLLTVIMWFTIYSGGCAHPKSCPILVKEMFPYFPRVSDSVAYPLLRGRIRP